MKFKLDENLPVEAAAWLRQQGQDAHSVADERLEGSPDARIATICQTEQRVLITFGLGFSNVLQYPPGDYDGIIVLSLAGQDRDSVLAILLRILELLRTEPPARRLWIVDEKRTRIRGDQ